MNLSDFRDIVNAHARAGGVSFIDTTDEVAMNAQINRALKAFTAHTYMLPVFDYAIDLIPNQAEQSTKDVFDVQKVSIGGQAMREIGGTFRSMSMSELDSRYPNWEAEAAGTPSTWVALPNKKILLYPKPDSALTVTLRGFREHIDLISDTGIEGELELEDRYVPIAAEWVAESLARPYAMAADISRELLVRSQVVGNEIKMLHENNRNILGGRTRKRQTTRRISL